MESTLSLCSCYLIARRWQQVVKRWLMTFAIVSRFR